ncbi:hypothetical protein EH30_10010 [Erythrobacter sp. JL475]|nr:hypothetical protein EH30_10010 [Erythrobacter sp. JL475]
MLVTVCAVEGSSMRNPGTIMGVAQDGSFAGSLSGGCIENAVVAEAIEALKAIAPRIVRFGAGSPYLDIKLPCGGGLDVHFQPLGDGDLVEQSRKSIRERAPFSISLGDTPRHIDKWHAPTFDGERGTFGYWPAPVLQIIGHGASVEALARLGRTLGCWIKVFTPDQRIIDGLTAEGIWAYRLARANQTSVLGGDPWTATVFLFHDHDWETQLMLRALELPHFYIGAMGGRKAHAQRCEALAKCGATAEQIASIRAPIGLFHSSRDPQTLALSALAEVIRAYDEADFAAVASSPHG